MAVAQKFAQQHKRLSAVVEKFPVEVVYLFGSLATGNAHEKSDVDIAVLFSPRLSKERCFDLRLNLMEELGKVFQRPVDVVSLNDTSSLFFQYVIVREGKVVYERNAMERAEFESRIMARFFDFEPFLDRYNRSYVKAGR